MELIFFIKGLILGFSVAAPVGPIGILCIQRTIRYGRFSGLFSGLGAAAADTVYGLIAVLSLTFLIDLLLAGRFWLHLIGGIFLIYLGYKTFTSKPPVEIKTITHKTLIGDFFSTFFLTLANPMTILSYIAIFAALGLSEGYECCLYAIEIISGVFLGSALWWLILSEGVTLFRKKVSQEVMHWINRIAGILIITFGVAAILISFF